MFFQRGKVLAMEADEKKAAENERAEKHNVLLKVKKMFEDLPNSCMVQELGLEAFCERHKEETFTVNVPSTKHLLYTHNYILFYVQDTSDFVIGRIVGLGNKGDLTEVSVQRLKARVFRCDLSFLDNGIVRYNSWCILLRIDPERSNYISVIDLSKSKWEHASVPLSRIDWDWHYDLVEFLK